MDDAARLNEKKQRLDPAGAGGLSSNVFSNNGLVGLIWTLVSTADWISSLSKVNRAFRCCSRRRRPLDERIKALEAQSKAVGRNKSLTEDQMHLAYDAIDAELRQVRAWRNTPPCMDCGIRVPTYLRLPGWIVAHDYRYCALHTGERVTKRKQQWKEEKAAQGKQVAVQAKLGVLKAHANAGLTRLQQAHSELSPEARAAIKQLVASVMEQMQDAVAAASSDFVLQSAVSYLELFQER